MVAKLELVRRYLQTAILAVFLFYTYTLGWNFAKAVVQLDAARLELEARQLEETQS